MRLIILGSSSKGNCYLLQAENGETLLLECGVNINDIKRALNFSFTNVAGCLVTHDHQDHCCSIKEVMNFGMAVYASRGTIRALGLNITHHRLNTIKAGDSFQVGSFKIIAFEIQHDVPEPLGFYINHPESGNVLFITDSYYIKNTFKNLHNIIIEANFSNEIVRDRMSKGYLPDYRANRIFKSHMSLETCKQTLQANDLSKVQNIVLIHLSDGNSNALQFQKEITGATGKKVTVADEGIIIENFNKTAF